MMIARQGEISNSITKFTPPTSYGEWLYLYFEEMKRREKMGPILWKNKALGLVSEVLYIATKNGNKTNTPESIIVALKIENILKTYYGSNGTGLPNILNMYNIFNNKEGITRETARQYASIMGNKEFIENPLEAHFIVEQLSAMTRNIFISYFERKELLLTIEDIKNVKKESVTCKI